MDPVPPEIIPKSSSEDTSQESALKRGQETVRRVFVQLPLPPTVLSDDVDDVGRWAYLISQSETMEEIPGPLDKKVFKRALELCKVSRMAFKEQTYYFKWKKDQAMVAQILAEEKALRVGAEWRLLDATREGMDAEQTMLNAERERMDAEQRRLDAEQRMLSAERKRMDAEQRLLDTTRKRVDIEQRRLDAERELAELKDKLNMA